jgi:AcrR family transcriptional regulator
MSRTPDPSRRPALLAAAVDFLSAHGLGELSLRPLAKALGVSTYALVYHFGSREGLLAAVIEEIERRQLAKVAEWSAADGDAETLGEAVALYWDWVTTDANLPQMRLVIEAAAVAATRSGLPGGVRERLVTVWVDRLTRAFRQQGLTPARARDEATFLHATLLGLFLDLLASGDRPRLDLAVRELARRCDAGAGAMRAVHRAARRRR